MTNNEQTQAEKLAAEIVWLKEDEWLGSSGYSPGDSVYQTTLEELIVKAITQATAELRAENERLLQQLKDQDAIFNGFSEEYDQAQAKVVLLVDIAERISGPVPNPEVAPNSFINFMTELGNDIKNALTDAQATADAYTAKVRREVIDGFVARILHGDDEHKAWLKSEADKYLLPEPAEAAEKGGAL